MLKLSAFNKRVNLTQKSAAPIVALLFWACYPCVSHYLHDRSHGF